MREKLNDKNYFEKNKLNMAGIRKEEAKLKNAIQPVMFQFQQRGIYRTEVIQKKLNKEPEHFSLNCEFLRQLNFDTDLSYLQ